MFNQCSFLFKSSSFNLTKLISFKSHLCSDKRVLKHQEYRSNLTATVADKSSTLSTTDNVSEATSSVSKLCTFCGRSIHARSMCPAKNAVCFKCQRRGHFANVCKSKPFEQISINFKGPLPSSSHNKYLLV